jgi:protein-S-isoprenylcysteine O-methyltransferase Ste14
MDCETPSAAIPCPKSAVSHTVGIVGLVGLFTWVMIARNFGSVAAALGYPGFPDRADGPYSALIAVAFCGVPMLVWLIFIDKVHLRPSTGIDWKLKRPAAEVLDTSIIKLAGLWATWALIAAIYGVFRFWWTTQYANFPFAMDMFKVAAIPLIIASVPYVIWLDRYLIDPRDGSWHMGALIAGRGDWDKEQIFHHLRAWAVKGFFMAFMISIIPGGFQKVVMQDYTGLINNPAMLAGAMIYAMFMVDVQFASVGYLVTMKPFDAHIRTANPYLGGWVAALLCYPPFVLMNDILNYHVWTQEWSVWFAGHTALLYAWGAILVILTAIYAWATVAFGIRFSNLTHRGIITHGPYRWTRHPAYVSKNIFWWLSTLPFWVTSENVADGLRNVTLIAMVSGIYYWRAKTEEKHLLSDPAYAAYYEWMETHAPIPRFFARLKRLLTNRPKPAQGNPAIEPAE